MPVPAYNTIRPSAEEDRLLRSLVRQLYRHPRYGLTRASLLKYSEWYDILDEASRWKRDEYGKLCIQTVLEAILLAANEMGLSYCAEAEALLKNRLGEKNINAPDTKRSAESNVRMAMESFARITLFLQAKDSIIETEQFRNLFVSQCGDMRILLLTIAEAVCNMRHIRDTKAEAQRRHLAKLSANLFAPLAHKIGLYAIKSELEDLSLKYLEPEAYYHIKDKLNATKQKRDAYIEAFIAPLRQKMADANILCRIKGRTKSIHSIWQKMKKQGCAFEGVYDLFAIRIIIDNPIKQSKNSRKIEEGLCWTAYDIVRADREINLNRQRNWLSVPKSNGYESLHITVRGPEHKWVEVQIRTARMDDIAEHGLAAHWRYKGIREERGGIETWLANIRTALEHGNDQQLSQQLSEGIQDKHIYVFSPKGDLYQLSKGATVLDFAYHIHTNVGSHCVGARINGKNVPIRQKLENGQRVEIITSSTQTPRLEWLQIVVSSKARSKIRAALSEVQDTAAKLAREELERKLKRRKWEWIDGLWNQVIRKLGYKENGDFFKDIASGKLESNKALDIYQNLMEAERTPANKQVLHTADEYDINEHFDNLSGITDDVVVIDKNVRGLDFRAARCCNPVYGDNVFGFVTVNGGITIHRLTCPNAPSLRQRFPYRIVKARWAGKGLGRYPVTLRIVGRDDLGIVNNITSIISKENNILLRTVNIDSRDGLFSGMITIMIDDSQELARLIKKIQDVKGVKSVSRN